MIIDKISNTINYRKLFVAGTAVLAVSAAMAGTYKVVVPLSEDEEGAMAYLSNYDTGENIDSVLVADNKAVFTGKLDKAIAALDCGAYVIGEIVSGEERVTLC